MAVSQSTVNEITNWYQSIVGRAPDAEGLNYWSSKAANGEDMNALRSTFVNSAAYVASRGGEKVTSDQVRANAANYGMLSQPSPSSSTSTSSAPSAPATFSAAASPSLSPYQQKLNQVAALTGKSAKEIEWLDNVTGGTNLMQASAEDAAKYFGTGGFSDNYKRAAQTMGKGVSGGVNTVMPSFYGYDKDGNFVGDQPGGYVVGERRDPAEVAAEYARTGKALTSFTPESASSAIKAAAMKPSQPSAQPSPQFNMMRGSSTPASSTGGNANVGNWYRSVLGRDAEQGGEKYWTDQIAARGGDVESVFNDFLASARSNTERMVGTGMTWQQANQYNGPASMNSATPMDDVARNVLGRDFTPDELKTWDTRMTAAAKDGVEGVKSAYQDFLKEYSGEVKRPMDWSSAMQINPGWKKDQGTTSPGSGNGVTTLNLDELDRRLIDPKTETVKGQMVDLLREDSPYMVQARYDAMRQAAERGMLNSVMAASAGEDAAIRSALGIATPDAATFGRAADYNAALENQARMWNAGELNQFARQKMGIDADAAARRDQLQQQLSIAQMQDSTTRRGQDNQMSVAQLEDGTRRWVAELNDATSRYNTDKQYQQQADNNKRTMVNNIIHNMDLSPDRKAALLEQLGEGTSARRDPNTGRVIPGTGLAGAVYVIDDVAADLVQTAQTLPLRWGDHGRAPG